MKAWLLVLAVPGVVILGFSIAFLLRRRQSVGSDAQKHSMESRSNRENFQSAMGKLRISYNSNSNDNSLRFHHLNQHHARQMQPIQKQGKLFNWDDHPGLISDAVENGWSRFTFSSCPSSSSPSRPASLLNFLVVSGNGRQREVETGWEVPLGSVDYMQTVRLNPGLKRIGGSSISPLDGGESCCCARMALPLPGPPMVEFSFPQEAYFEITILHLQQPSGTRKRAKVSSGDEDQLILIQDNSKEGQLIHDGIVVEEEERLANEGESIFKDVVISTGFTMAVDGSSRNKVPGSYPGSIGFHSNGSVHLNGRKLVFESDKVNWGAVNRVIGCGFDPSEKKVFFTVDSVLLHVVRCNSDAFKSPLYPSLAANTAAVMVLVNLGQRPFKYRPANAHRTPDPCFLRPLAAASGRSVLVGYDDSGELFSMEDIGTKNSCITLANTKNSNNGNTDGSPTVGSIVVDIEVESEMFEISLNS